MWEQPILQWEEIHQQRPLSNRLFIKVLAALPVQVKTHNVNLNLARHPPQWMGSKPISDNSFSSCL
ncbi:Hypothetical protein P9303_09441 [Prochlorococcus marinus str. MIT 9303]|uniref:Uncharacterized protein n=1 Tax=Prochlorococcus marinus (strain MIT 9303) TaxID=59922 RepID=A2C885_PROM3|nr:Hypothetical protein P9303_09441 [Prochlorococcus marinus str. MIT 9303]